MITIIRHGQTDQNAAHVLQGRSDYPLNAEGRAGGRADTPGARHPL